MNPEEFIQQTLQELSHPALILSEDGKEIIAHNSLMEELIYDFLKGQNRSQNSAQVGLVLRRLTISLKSIVALQSSTETQPYPYSFDTNKHLDFGGNSDNSSGNHGVKVTVDKVSYENSIFLKILYVPFTWEARVSENLEPTAVSDSSISSREEQTPYNNKWFVDEYYNHPVPSIFMESAPEGSIFNNIKEFSYNQAFAELLGGYLISRDIESTEDARFAVLGRLLRQISAVYEAHCQNQTQEIFSYKQVIANKLHDFSGDNSLSSGDMDHSGHFILYSYLVHGNRSFLIDFYPKEGFIRGERSDITLSTKVVNQMEDCANATILFDPRNCQVLGLNKLMADTLTRYWDNPQELGTVEIAQECLNKLLSQEYTDGAGNVLNSLKYFRFGMDDNLIRIVNSLDLDNAVKLGLRENQNFKLAYYSENSLGKDIVFLEYRPEEHLFPEILGDVQQEQLDDAYLEECLAKRGEAGILIHLNQQQILYSNQILRNLVNHFNKFAYDSDSEENQKQVLGRLLSFVIEQAEVVKKEDSSDSYVHVTPHVDLLSLLHGRAFSWSSYHQKQWNPLCNINFHFGTLGEENYLYVYFHHYYDFPSREYPTFEGKRPVFYEDCKNPAVLIDIETRQVLSINPLMDTLLQREQKLFVELEQQYLRSQESLTATEREFLEYDENSMPQSGLFSQVQLLQRLVMESTTKSRISDVRSYQNLYEMIDTLSDMNPSQSYPMHSAKGNIVIADDSWVYDVEQGKTVAHRIGLRGAQCAYITLKRVEQEGRFFAQMEFQKLDEYTANCYSVKEEDDIYREEYLSPHLPENTPALIVDIDSGRILDFNGRILDKVRQYCTYLQNNLEAPRYFPLSTYFSSFLYYEVFREFYATAYFNPLKDWNKEKPLVYPIYDLGINEPGEQFTCNCFDLSVEVTVMPKEIDGKVRGVVTFVPLLPEKPLPQDYTHYNGMAEWQFLLQQRADSAENSSILPRLDTQECLRLLTGYYQAEHAIFLWSNDLSNSERVLDHTFPDKEQFRNIYDNTKALSVEDILKEPHKRSNSFKTESYFQTGYELFSLRDPETLKKIKEEILGKSTHISSSKHGRYIFELQRYLAHQLTSLGIAVCADDSNVNYGGIILLLNPKQHLKDNHGQEELLYSVTRALTIEATLGMDNLKSEVKLELPEYLPRLLEEVNEATKRLEDVFKVGDGQSGLEPVEALLPFWKSLKPKEMGIIYSSLAEKNWEIPEELQQTLIRGNRKADAIPGDYSDDAYEMVKADLPIRRYSGSTPLFACFAWKKRKFEELVKAIEKETPEGELVGHAWGNGYYWLEQLMENAKLLQFIKGQQQYYQATWENATNPHLARLLHDLSENRYHVMLQPQVELNQDLSSQDFQCHGAEALIRRSDDSSFPDEFVPLFEEQGIVRHIDFFVLETVCQSLQAWKDCKKKVRISVNLSRVTLMEPHIVDSIVEIVDKYEVDHEQVMMEITERVGLIEHEISMELVAEFQKHNFKISLDDFGSDSSNLSALSKIPVDEVKMDKGLVDYIADYEGTKQNPSTKKDGKVNLMVQNIISMCRAFADEPITLAEGIENEAQASVLKNFKCLMGQGYYFSRPISIENFYEKFVKDD